MLFFLKVSVKIKWCSDYLLRSAQTVLRSAQTVWVRVCVFVCVCVGVGGCSPSMVFTRERQAAKSSRRMNLLFLANRLNMMVMASAERSYPERVRDSKRGSYSSTLYSCTIYPYRESISCYIHKDDGHMYNMRLTQAPNGICNFSPLQRARTVFVKREEHFLYWS